MLVSAAAEPSKALLRDARAPLLLWRGLTSGGRVAARVCHSCGVRGGSG